MLNTISPEAPTNVPGQSEHSKFSPSSAQRWLACPGSLMYPGEDRTSVYAAEGTVAHALAHYCWMLGCEAATLVGQSRSCDGYTIPITDEMAAAVQIYLDFIEALADGQPVITETRIIHSLWTDFGGTLDCAIPSKGHFVDFKYGAGLAVEAERNDQMSCYALLFQDHFGVGGDAEFTIVQPRASHADGPIRSWIAEEDYLADFESRVSSVFIGERAEELHAGDWCRWCPLKAQCPELHDLTLKIAADEFLADKMTPAKAAEILSKEVAVKSYLEAVDAWVHGQLDKGMTVPGYKLVNRYGNRRYAFDEPTVERRCRNKGFGKKQIYVTELMSPAQLEKVVGKDLIASLVERPHAGTTVVSVSDKREAVVRQSASDEFSGAGEK